MSISTSDHCRSREAFGGNGPGERLAICQHLRLLHLLMAHRRTTIARHWRSICMGDGLAVRLARQTSGDQLPAMFGILLHRAVATGAIIAVILYNSALLGVFGLPVAIASLIFGIVFVVLVVVRTRTQDEPVERT
jgi:hypothetical protein